MTLKRVMYMLEDEEVAIQVFKSTGEIWTKEEREDYCYRGDLFTYKVNSIVFVTDNYGIEVALVYLSDRRE